MGLQDRDYWGHAWKHRDEGDIHAYHYGTAQAKQTPVASRPRLSRLWQVLRVIACFYLAFKLVTWLMTKFV